MKSKKLTGSPSERLAAAGAGFVAKFLFFTLLIGLCFTVLYPILKALPTVFNDLNDLGNPNVTWVPEQFSVNSFKLAIRMVFGNGLPVLQTLLYSITIALIQMIMSAMVGYVLGRNNSKICNLLTVLVIIAIMVPPQALLVSQYLAFKNFDVFGLISLFNGGETIDLVGNAAVLYILALTGFGLRQNVYVFIFRQSFRGFPKELEEAALIDGCGFYRTYFQIAFPNVIPSMVTVTTLSFVWNYGDTFYTTYFDPTGPYLANTLSGTFQWSNRDFVAEFASTYFGFSGNSAYVLDAVKYAAVLLFLLPLLILYFFMQKKLVENFERSGIVG